jgi:hypothetical protein
MSVELTSHIWLDDRQVAWIDNTNLKVIEVALEHLAHGSSAEEICDQHRGQLTLGQVHAALGHYYDHQADFEQEIERQLRDYDTKRSVAADSPGRQRLRAMGRIQ